MVHIFEFKFYMQIKLNQNQFEIELNWAEIGFNIGLRMR